MAHDIPVREIGELLDQVSEKVPRMISGILESMYSAGMGRQMGQAVGGMYQELIEAGIPKEDALQMAKEYMISIKGVMDSAIRSDHRGKDAPDSEG